MLLYDGFIIFIVHIDRLIAARRFIIVNQASGVEHNGHIANTEQRRFILLLAVATSAMIIAAG